MNDLFADVGWYLFWTVAEPAYFEGGARGCKQEKLKKKCNFILKIQY